MPLTPFTTNEQVRSVLGVSEDELIDETLNLPIYELNLRYELGEVSGSLAADFVTIAALDETTWTDKQKGFVDAVKLFSPYAVSVQLETSLPLFSPKEITDGKASLVRYTDS